MKMNKYKILFLLLLLVLFSCEPKVPSKYIQPSKFEDILYDYHIAKAMASENDDSENESYDAYLYSEAVLKKYNITEAELDSSLVYYMRHGDKINKIYENISKRLSNSALALGASQSEINRFGDMGLSGDTTNIWIGATSVVLTPSSAYNVLSFEIEADTTFYEGDKIILSFNSDFFSKNSSKMATAMLVLDLNNDSVASRSLIISTNKTSSLNISDDKHKGIKRVRGFIYLNKERENFSNENKSIYLLFVDDIRLIKMHEKDTPDEPDEDIKNEKLPPDRIDKPMHLRDQERLLNDSLKQENLQEETSDKDKVKDKPKPAIDFSQDPNQKRQNMVTSGTGEQKTGNKSEPQAKPLPQDNNQRRISRTPQR